MNRVLHVRRVARVNSGGKVRSVSALVVVGNGNGVAGYGEGRGADMQSAVLKATRNAEKNLNYFHRFNNRTVYQSGEFQWHGVKLKIMAAPPGYGIITSNPIHEICRMVGISDLGVKVYGSRNPMNVIKAMFEALKTQRLPEEIARMRGKRVEDVELRYYGMNSKK
ncbi:ribosomal protein S5, C-terminal domain-containing protein [Gaertneriomyces semiglobifer]|nr:ribosomal protein S5, C-terminal domain-containing protein [Gaertneriomyces semiglobifer]